MADTTAPVGKQYPPLTYLVGREKIREYARAVGETDPLHLDVAAARAAGHADLVAPPMFVVVYAMEAVSVGMFDPEVGIDFPRLVHGAQRFTWARPLIAGEEVATTVRLDDVREIAAAGITSYVFAHESVDERGAIVSTGLWTNHVRGAGA